MLLHRITQFVVGLVRSTDPDTSIAAASVDRTRLSDRVLTTIQGGYYEPRTEGWTGKELAIQLHVPLNSITPRLAPLRRLGLIKDSGIRRDKQTAWIACDPEEKDWNE